MEDPCQGEKSDAYPLVHALAEFLGLVGSGS